MASFVGEENFDHARIPKIGVLLVNMGTPDAPTAEALRPYLKQFLWDARVIEYPRILWWLILHLFVLTRRPKRSAALYAKVWTAEGSPLLVHSRRQTLALEQELKKTLGESVIVELGMRYGNPSIPSALNALRKKGMRRLLVLPLYPQYSGTTTASGIDAIADELRTWRWVPEMRTVNQYHDDPGYIAALAESVREVWAREGEPEKLLMSFHGIPKRYFMNGDPYHCQCLKTGRLLGEKLGLSPERYQVCFQSLFGREEWLKPYTNETLISWAKQGFPKKIDAMCPGFTSDCLETLEEIDVENRGYFLDNGGGSYRFIPCLNERPAFIQALADITRRNLQGWIEETPAAAEAKARESEALYKRAANSR